MIFSCGAVNGPPKRACPSRLAGTWRQYSGSAISQEIRMAVSIGQVFLFSWLYQATVMKTLDPMSSRTAVSQRGSMGTRYVVECGMWDVGAVPNGSVTSVS